MGKAFFDIDLKKMNHEETKITKRGSERFSGFSFLLRVLSGLRGEILFLESYSSGGTIFFFNQATRGDSFVAATNTRGIFSIPEPGTLGNTGRNFFTGPRFFQLDLAFAKRIRIVEQQFVQFRADLQNFTNTPSFGFPTATII